MTRRTHSSVDSLPAELRGVVTRMVTDGYWPEECGDDHKGRPTYDDVIEYIVMQGYSVSRSAFGRWAKNLVAMEVLRSRAEIVRNVMAEGESPQDFADSQRATADILNARIMEAACSGELTPKQTRELAAAAKDCLRIRIDHDEYRRQIEQRIKDADEKITEIAAKKQFDPETLKMIREEIYGITN